MTEGTLRKTGSSVLASRPFGTRNATATEKIAKRLEIEGLPYAAIDLDRFGLAESRLLERA